MQVPSHWGTASSRARAPSHPETRLTAVINIYNGPGDGALPDQGHPGRHRDPRSVQQQCAPLLVISTTWFTRNVSAMLDVKLMTYMHLRESIVTTGLVPGDRDANHFSFRGDGI